MPTRGGGNGDSTTQPFGGIVQSMRRLRKIFGWVFWVLGMVYGVTKMLADWIGRSTLPEDAAYLVRKMAPMLEFLQRQPDLWFYVASLALATVGLLLLIWDRLPAFASKGDVAAIEEPPKPEPTLATVAELSQTDFPEYFKLSATLQVEGARTEGKIHLCINEDSHSKFLAVYIPHTEFAEKVIQELAALARNMVDHLQKSVHVISKSPVDTNEVEFNSIPFVNRVVVYYEGRLSLQQRAALDSVYRENGLTLTLRGSDYVTAKWMAERANSKQSR